MSRHPMQPSGAILACLLAGGVGSSCGAVESGVSRGNDGGRRDASSMDAGPVDDADEGGSCPEHEGPTWAGTEAGIAILDAQGRLLVILHSNPSGTGADAYSLQRRTSAATVDPAFGSQGSVSLTGTPVDLAVGPTGTVVVAVADPKDTESLLAFDSSGAPLAGFDATAAITSKGFWAAPSTPWDGSGYGLYNGNPKQTSLVFQPNGDLLVLIGATKGTNDTSVVVARLQQGGSIDTTFASGGYLTVQSSIPWDIALLPSGDFVLVTQDDSASTITAAWYSSAGVALGPTAPIVFNSYEGILTRSDGTTLLGTGSGDTATFNVYSPAGVSVTGEAPQIPWTDHRFIGPRDALTYVPGLSAAITVHAILPDGTAEPAIQGTCAVPAGDSVLFLDGIADGRGGVFLVGETCDPVKSDCIMRCTALVVQLSSSGVLTQ